MLPLEYRQFELISNVLYFSLDVATSSNWASTQALLSWAWEFQMR